MIFCEWCGNSGHKTNYVIIICSNFLPPTIHRKRGQYNTIYGYKSKETPNEFTRKPHIFNFIPPTSTPQALTENRHINVVSYIIGKPNHYAVDNGYV